MRAVTLDTRSEGNTLKLDKFILDKYDAAMKAAFRFVLFIILTDINGSLVKDDKSA